MQLMTLKSQVALLLIVPLRTASNFFNDYRNCIWRE